jgi:hypothetical protein
MVLDSKLLNEKSTTGDQTSSIDDLINLFVSLKSKPFAVLVGPKNTGKREASISLGRLLTGDSPIRNQRMTGHPWWTEGSQSQSDFSLIQTQFSIQKFHSVIIEASRSDNLKDQHVLLMSSISPAELDGYFLQVATQLKQGLLSQLSNYILPQAVFFPPNLNIIGTLDLAKFIWHDNSEAYDLITVINWPEENDLELYESELEACIGNDLALYRQSKIRKPANAWKKLQAIAGWRTACLAPVLELISILVDQQLPVSPRKITDEAIIYLANSWSIHGRGLYSGVFSENLSKSLDRVLIQTVLPNDWRAIYKRNQIVKRIQDFIGDHFPVTNAVLENWLSA